MSASWSIRRVVAANPADIARYTNGVLYSLAKSIKGANKDGNLRLRHWQF